MNGLNRVNVLFSGCSFVTVDGLNKESTKLQTSASGANLSGSNSPVPGEKGEFVCSLHVCVVRLLLYYIIHCFSLLNDHCCDQSALKSCSVMYILYTSLTLNSSPLFSSLLLSSLSLSLSSLLSLPGVAGIPSAPDGGALAYVLRTGFGSSQGSLLQMIEFSQQTVAGEFYCFLCGVVCVCVVCLPLLWLIISICIY